MPFTYPTSAEYFEIEPELIQREQAGRAGFEICPVRPRNAAKVRWTQKDAYYGLQQLRGMDGEPTHVTRVGQRTYEYEPGVFGEYVDITESELTNRAGSVDINSVPISVDDLVLDAETLLIQRELDRMESSVWAILTTGTITIKIDGPNGVQTGYSDTYAIQSFTAGVPWSTFATATPMRNFQVVQQLYLGHSVDLGAGATAWMNSVTANNLLNNQNSTDVAGRRAEMGATFNNLTQFNTFFMGLNLPKMRIYDGGYIPTIGGAFQKFISDNKVVVVGRRITGAQVMEYQITRNASAGFAPRSYNIVLDRANGVNASRKIPANIEIHRGHNGGPAIYYPSAVVVMSV